MLRLSRRTMMWVVTAALVGTIFVTSAGAAPGTLRARVTFQPRPADLTFQSTAQGTARFKTSFESISSLCFTFSLARDVLDPGDELELHVEGWGGAFSTNPSTEPQDEVTLCVDENNPEVISLFLDGQNDFTVLMLTGTARLTRVEVAAVGVQL